MTTDAFTRSQLVRHLSLNALLTSPILPTLIRLAAPNMISMLAIAMVAIAETAYVGLLGVPTLAAMAEVAPVSWTSEHLRFRSSRCQRYSRLTRRNSGSE
jgi:ABC-type arginine transport system permease subunit